MAQTPTDASRRFAFAGTSVEILLPTWPGVGACAMLRMTMPRGNTTPVHAHRHEAESVYVLSGRLRVEEVRRTVELAAGEAATLPPGRPHRLSNAADSDTVVLVVTAPGGFENFVRAAGRPIGLDESVVMTGDDAARLGEAAAAFEITLLPDESLRPLP